MSKPLVEIIIVNYNNAPDTIECIRSLKKITYENYHIIIVDNGSSDSSVELLLEEKSIEEFELICLSENRGFSAGNNVGIKYAMENKAEYVLFLNNDTLVQANFLTELVEFQERHDECDVAIGKIYYAYELKRIWYAGGTLSLLTGRTVHKNYRKRELQIKEEGPIEVTFATGCCMCLKKNVITDVGKWDEEYFLYEEDSDYCCRMMKARKHIFYIPSSIIYHKVSATTGELSPLTQYYMARNRFLFVAKNFTGFKKIIAYIYSFAFLIKRCISQEIEWQYTFKGIHAYYKGEKGKRIVGVVK